MVEPRIIRKPHDFLLPVVFAAVLIGVLWSAVAAAGSRQIRPQ